eukprot:scaffold272191_cov35-Tisochrysis_lutea.AAC.2
MTADGPDGRSPRVWRQYNCCNAMHCHAGCCWPALEPSPSHNTPMRSSVSMKLILTISLAGGWILPGIKTCHMGYEPRLGAIPAQPDNGYKLMSRQHLPNNKRIKKISAGVPRVELWHCHVVSVQQISHLTVAIRAARTSTIVGAAEVRGELRQRLHAQVWSDFTG